MQRQNKRFKSYRNSLLYPLAQLSRRRYGAVVKMVSALFTARKLGRIFGGFRFEYRHSIQKFRFPQNRCRRFAG